MARERAVLRELAELVAVADHDDLPRLGVLGRARPPANLEHRVQDIAGDGRWSVSADGAQAPNEPSSIRLLGLVGLASVHGSIVPGWGVFPVATLAGWGAVDVDEATAGGQHHWSGTWQLVRV